MKTNVQKREAEAGKFIAVIAAVMVCTLVMVGVLVGMFGVMGLN